MHSLPPGLRSLPRRQVIFTLAGVMLAMFLSSLDQTVVGTAMPRIIADLGGFSRYTWVATAYMVTSTVVLPITGKLTDMFGRKYFYLAGLGIFMLGSAFCGLSQTMTQIIFARGFQGIGAGMMMANAFTIVADLFPPAERGKYQGFMSAVFGVSSVVGPTLGGYITDALSWHWIFYINLPLGLVIITLFALFFPNFRPDGAGHRVDYVGVTLLVVTVIPLLLALSWGGIEYAWTSTPVLTALAVAFAGALGFFFVERRAPEPIVPMGIFRNSIVSLTFAIIFLNGIAMFAGIFFIPLFFQGVMGLSATSSGSFLTPMMLGMVTAGAVSGQILSRRGGHYRRQGMVGLGLMVIGTFLLSRMGPETGYAVAVANIVISGIGLGITMPIYVIAIQNAVPYKVLGAATSLVAFSRSIGGTLGVAVCGSVMNNRLVSEFFGRLPETVRPLIPPDFLTSVSRSAQALVSPEAQEQLKTAFGQLGAQGPVLYEQTIQLLRQSLGSALSWAFLLGCVITFIALIINFFLKEIPLRKQYARE
ncbi:MAG: MFS transporter [Dehalococcoidia bacterium]|nr:MFS transporter [Dehalococcoidia bacterium]